MSNNHCILLTIDVEDWFQVENFKRCIPFSSWPSRELRVEANTHRLLDLLDSTESAQSSKLKAQSEKENCSTTDSYQLNELSAMSYELKNAPKATFFILGWIAERLPHLVREIQSRGHEVASHGYYHNLCNQQSPAALKKDLTDSKKLLEDITGAPVYGYRAPSFSISNEILKLIEDCGYLYDSSYNSFALHGRYGHIDLSQNGKNGIALQIQSEIRNPKSEIFYELPISNLKLGNRILPWGGGGYFRLMPLRLFEIGVKSILKKHGAYLFYMHPWEVDPEQPRIKKAGPSYRARHYVNLDKTHSKLLRLIQSFEHCNFVTCSQYLSAISYEL